MSITNNAIRVRPSPLIVQIVLMFSCLYWSYHVLVSQMVIVQDAHVYKGIADIFYKDGWIGYFKSGPTREPFYPFLISGSMHLESWLHISYQDIQKIFQLCLALSAQYLLWIILRNLRVNTAVIAGVLFFFAVSPDIVNSIVSLFCEVVAFPIVLFIVFLSTRVQHELFLPHISYQRLISQSFLLGLFFFLLICTKGAFEFVFPFYILALFLLFLPAWKTNNRSTLKRAFLILITIMLTTQLPLQFVKSMNKKYNGNYVLTERGAFMLYGNTTRHLEAFSWKRIVMGFICVTQASEQKICKKLFSEQECAFWDFRNSDAYAHQKCNQLASEGYSQEESNKILVQLTIEKILKSPFQYFPYYCLEGLAVIFWKSGEIGFVAYPDWLSFIYDKTPVRFILSLLSAVLTLLALMRLAILNLGSLKSLLHRSVIDKKMVTLFLIGGISFAFIALHATISVLTRYCLVIVPLYLISIAVFLDRFCSKSSSK